jgi:hypothetical protein
MNVLITGFLRVMVSLRVSADEVGRLRLPKPLRHRAEDKFQESGWILLAASNAALGREPQAKAAVSLESHVPDDHLLRKIDRFVDLNELRAHLGPYYSETGRPSIDPDLMMRTLIVG